MGIGKKVFEKKINLVKFGLCQFTFWILPLIRAAMKNPPFFIMFYHANKGNAKRYMVFNERPSRTIMCSSALYLLSLIWEISSDICAKLTDFWLDGTKNRRFDLNITFLAKLMMGKRWLYYVERRTVVIKPSASFTFSRTLVICGVSDACFYTWGIT